MSSLLTTALLLLSLGCQTGQNAPATLDKFYAQTFEEELSYSPQRMNYLGIKEKYNEWDDLSPEADEAAHKRQLHRRRLLEGYSTKSLDGQDKLSYELYRQHLEESIASYKYRYHNYPVNQMFGLQSRLPSFLINIHRIDQLEDAKAYIGRLQKVEAQFEQLIKNLDLRADRGIIPPLFVYEKVIRDCKNILQGYPFESTASLSTLFKDFKEKLDTLAISQSQKDTLLDDAKEALQTSVKPAYLKLIDTMNRLEARAPARVGAWSLPDGDAFYRYRLKQITTTDLSPQDIHQLGLREVARIHKAMNHIRRKVGFKGDLKAFFAHLKADKRFYYPQTSAGRNLYLKDTKKIISRIEKTLPKVFGILPQAPLVVKPVEAFREASAGIAFYESPSPDGLRPGTYYVNLYDLKQVPRYEMEALAYHEAVPGHHLERTISQELKNLPKFRRFGGYTAFTEGWGLYSERLPKDLGFYQDPYSDFGRLSMELWRATRLVVDTGIHWKRWSRQEAINYLLDHTPADKGEVVKAINRYIIMPGQATAYTIGMHKILELRERAKKKMGPKFQLKAFHDEVLRNGPLPLSKLDAAIDRWILGFASPRRPSAT